MKKTFVLLSMVALSTVSMAQKGSWYIGGLLGYSSSTTKSTATGIKEETMAWTASPEFGTFLKDDIQLGLALGFSGDSHKYDGTEITKSSTINPTLYGRKFFKITDNFSTFTGLYLTYISGTNTDNSNFEPIETKDAGFGVRLGIGIAYALSPRFTAVGQYGLFGYESVTTKYNGTEVSTDSGMDFGVNTVGGSSLAQGNGSGSVFNIGLYYTICPAPASK